MGGHHENLVHLRAPSKAVWKGYFSGCPSCFLYDLSKIPRYDVGPLC